MIIFQAHMSRAINSAINDRVIPVIQNFMGLLSTEQKKSGFETSTNNQEGANKGVIYNFNKE